MKQLSSQRDLLLRGLHPYGVCVDPVSRRDVEHWNARNPNFAVDFHKIKKRERE